jgi:hypothetical protein
MLAVLALTALPWMRPAAEPGSVPADKYEEPEFCKACHRELHSQWDGTMHSHATDDPFYAGAFALASRETEGLVDHFCSACHTPAGFLAGELPPVDHSKLSDVSRKGVFCDFCHTMTGHEAPFNARYLVDPGEIKRGPFGDAEAMGHEAQFSEFHTDPEFCATCHDVDHPVNGLHLETTYKEWAAGPYNTGDRETRTVCQDCHMTPGPGVTKPNPGKASEIGKERPHIFTHNAVGGGGVAALMGEEGTMRLATERLQAAAELALGLPQNARAGAEAEVRVEVTNVGCGHSIPTGVTELRDVWLELIVEDAAGNVVFTSGELTEAGEIAEGAVRYGVVVADADGNPTPKFWLAASKVLDHRIPPKETVTETYSVPIPADAAGPLKVRARLRYRAASPVLLREMMGPDVRVDLPIVDMATTEGELKLAQ